MNDPQRTQPMITLTTEPPAVHVDWMWTVSVERVLDAAPDLLTWAAAPFTE
mgnify:FL=1